MPALYLQVTSEFVLLTFFDVHLQPGGFSPCIANHIGGAAWPVAMVLMAPCEVGARLTTAYLRTHQLTGTAATPTVALGSAA